MVTAHPTDTFDFRSGDWLLIGNNGQCFQKRIGQYILTRCLCNFNQILIHFGLRTHLEGIL